MENIKHIFFDLDNTLWDYRKNAKLKLIRLFEDYNVQETYNLTFPNFYSAYYSVNESLWADYRDKKISRNELQTRRFVETFQKLGIQNYKFSAEMESRLMTEVVENQEVVEGTESVLPYLYKKYNLHILSNGFEEITHKKIQGCLIKDYIQTVTTSDGAGTPKPDPKAFQSAVDKAGATKEESIYIGDDWIADMEGATKFGMRAIFFNPLNESHVGMENVPVIEKLIELKNYL
ncbi:MAG: YjjG family noncanonical pyrimidine nucleotidase [Weeksellaceae bacterium]|jgi:putative hydrolase of the HAD superfamily|nr:YjjG family noncanonical pyrimidine nucleotidase [Weeksellaceae bacterium]MDX9705178.1 YjjG family noncanonical pyrimidine nucleotidase [Weeksellaceae bacterium]